MHTAIRESQPTEPNPPQVPEVAPNLGCSGGVAEEFAHSWNRVRRSVTFGSRSVAKRARGQGWPTFGDGSVTCGCETRPRPGLCFAARRPIHSSSQPALPLITPRVELRTTQNGTFRTPCPAQKRANSLLLTKPRRAIVLPVLCGRGAVSLERYRAPHPDKRRSRSDHDRRHRSDEAQLLSSGSESRRIRSRTFASADLIDWTSHHLSRKNRRVRTSSKTSVQRLPRWRPSRTVHSLTYLRRRATTVNSMLASSSLIRRAVSSIASHVASLATHAVWRKLGGAPTEVSHLTGTRRCRSSRSRRRPETSAIRSALGRSPGRWMTSIYDDRRRRAGASG